ncbi:MAG TPA: hypothetical protein ENN72_08955 [Firmicutes bacterium]|nr:hypothetical protein [Bacillota bacterium]
MKKVFLMFFFFTALFFQAGAFSHNVEKGESLSMIVLNYTGTIEHVSFVARHNGIKRPDTIHAGQTIKIPLSLFCPASAYSVPEGFDAGYYKERGLAAVKEKNLYKAYGYLFKGYQKEPTAKSLKNVFLALYRLGRYESLLALHGKENEKSGESLMLAAFSAFALGKEEEGEAFLREAREKFPGFSQAEAALKYLEGTDGRQP